MENLEQRSNMVKDRLLEFIKYLGLNNSTFEKRCGMSNGYINSMRSSIGGKFQKNIEKEFPELNIIWLLHGVGEMLTESQEQNKIQSQEIKVDESGAGKNNELSLQVIADLVINQKGLIGNITTLTNTNNSLVNEKLW